MIVRLPLFCDGGRRAPGLCQQSRGILRLYYIGFDAGTEAPWGDEKWPEPGGFGQKSWEYGGMGADYGREDAAYRDYCGPGLAGCGPTDQVDGAS